MLKKSKDAVRKSETIEKIECGKVEKRGKSRKSFYMVKDKLRPAPQARERFFGYLPLKKKATHFLKRMVHKNSVNFCSIKKKKFDKYLRGPTFKDPGFRRS